jgi:ABC-2 type transport system permease protein
MDELNAQGMRLVGEDGRDEAERGIAIPSDFTEKVLATEQIEISFFKVQGSGGAPAAMIEVRLVRALVALNSTLIEFVLGNPPGTELSEAGLRELMESEDLVRLDAKYAGRDPIPAGYQQSVPGILVMYLLINLLSFGAISLTIERREGIIKRLAAYPVRRLELVLGKIFGRFLIGGVQILVLLAAGQLFFGVKVGHNLPLILMTLAIYSWMCAALGVLIGAVSSNVDRTLGLSIVVGMVMAALGGCWWPLEIVGDTMRAIGMSLPTGWAMSALHQLISFGGGFAQIDWQITALAVLGLVITLLAGRFLKYQ